MDYITQKDFSTFSKIELLHAEEILKKFGLQRFSNNDYYSNIDIGKKYDAADQSITYKKLQHLECSFNGIHFDGTDAAGSVLIDCTFDGCKISNAGFIRSDFTQSKFLSTDITTEITNSSFTDSNFMSCTFKQAKFEGCSFSNATFEDAQITDCSFCYCDFESSLFKNVILENVNFQAAGIDFAEFIDAKVKNTVLSLWGILWSFGGLDMVRSYPGEVKIGLPGSDKLISGSQLLEQLKDMEAHFYYKKDYFSLANINIFLGNQDNAFIYIKEGLIHYLKNKNFKMIRFLCKLASENYFFTKKQLSQLYFALQSDHILQKMTSYEYKNYLYEINIIKGLLIDNPFGMPQMTLRISTDIESNEKRNLIYLLTFIDDVFNVYAPQSNHVITIRHNSPFFIEIINSDSLNNIYNFALNLLLCVWGNIPEINALILSIMNAKKLLKENKVFNRELKKHELEIKKLELKNLKLTNELLVAEKETTDLQKELLKLEIQDKQEQLENRNNNRTADIEFLDNYIPNVNIPEGLTNRISKISFSVRYNEILPQKIREVSIEAPK